MKNRIITKTGDKGKTSLFSGERVLKSDVRFNIVGDIDELISVLGYYKRNKIKNEQLRKNIEEIQKKLFILNSQIASTKEIKTKICRTDIVFLEKICDKLSSNIDEIKDFVLPDHFLDIARCVCRRVERQLIKQYQHNLKWSNEIIFINRLSDTLYLFARYLEKNRIYLKEGLE